MSKILLITKESWENSIVQKYCGHWNDLERFLSTIEYEDVFAILIMNSFEFSCEMTMNSSIQVSLCIYYIQFINPLRTEFFFRPFSGHNIR